MKTILTLLFLVISNIFMTLAWYGHLRLKTWKGFESLGLYTIILLSWGIVLLEYCFQVPANKIEFRENGEPFSLLQLKVIQEVISLSIFCIFTLIVFKNEIWRWNHLFGFICLIFAVYFF